MLSTQGLKGIAPKFSVSDFISLAAFACSRMSIYEKCIRNSYVRIIAQELRFFITFVPLLVLLLFTEKVSGDFVRCHFGVNLIFKLITFSRVP